MIPLQQAIEDATRRVLGATPGAIDGTTLAEKIAKAAVHQLLGHGGYETALGIDPDEQHVANYLRGGWLPMRRTVRGHHVETLLARPEAYARLVEVCSAANAWRLSLVPGTSTAGVLACERLCKALDEYSARPEASE